MSPEHNAADTAVICFGKRKKKILWKKKLRKNPGALVGRERRCRRTATQQKACNGELIGAHNTLHYRSHTHTARETHTTNRPSRVFDGGGRRP